MNGRLSATHDRPLADTRSRAGGQAIADVLFGNANPSGKLPITFAQQDADLPQSSIDPNNLNVSYGEGLLLGYRWYDAKNVRPLFPFRFGLPYTTFAYSGMTAQRDGADNVTVELTVTNSDARTDAEVAQIYASLPAGLGEPSQRLVGWTKVMLQLGQARQISVAVPARRFVTCNSDAHAWQVNPGSYTLTAARSSHAPNAQT